MKTRLLNLLLITLAALAASSCRELSQDGDLAGQWQILTIEHPDGTVTNPEGHNYYCFYRNVCQLTNTNTTRITANMVYNESGATITLDFPYESIANLKPWGITQAGSALTPDVAPDPDTKTITLKINHLTSSRLTMTAPGGNVITCRKY